LASVALATSALAATLFVANDAAAQDKAAQDAAAKDTAKKPARMLMLTQSKGFKHGSVNRKDGQLAPSERAVTEIGISSNLFRVDCTQDAAADFTKANLQNYDLVFFYTTGDLPIAEADRVRAGIDPTHRVRELVDPAEGAAEIALPRPAPDLECRDRLLEPTVVGGRRPDRPARCLHESPGVPLS